MSENSSDTENSAGTTRLFEKVIKSRRKYLPECYQLTKEISVIQTKQITTAAIEYNHEYSDDKNIDDLIERVKEISSANIWPQTKVRDCKRELEENEIICGMMRREKENFGWIQNNIFKCKLK